MKPTMLATVLAVTLVCGIPASYARTASASPATSPSQEDLQQRSVERRAVEAVVWGMPAVNFQLMLDAFIAMGGAPNQVIYWSRPVNWRNQTLTPNPETIYFTPFYDTTNGPVVLDVPAASNDGSITGSIDDGWQNAIADVGPAGTDKGKGGRYLILPPNYKHTVPEGYIALRSSTFRGFALLRSNVKSGGDKDIADAVAYGRRIKLHPLSTSASGASETRFVDAYDKPYDATIPYDGHYFDALNRFVQAEPWLERDRVMIDTLGSLGIVKGQPVHLEEANKAAVERGAKEAHALIRLWTDEALAKSPFYDDAHWALPVTAETIKGMSDDFPDTNSYPVDNRAVMYSLGYFSAKQLGAGQFYLMVTRDSQSNALDGSRTYRLHVPANPPVKLYWSVTAYDAETHALIRDTSWSSRGSNTPGLKKNPDGSVDIVFGPKAPAGQEVNWMPTSPHGRFELLFRLYGPEKAFFDKAWKLPDLELQR